MPKVKVHKCEETTQGRKLFKGGNYMRKYGTQDVVQLCFKISFYLFIYLGEGNSFFSSFMQMKKACRQIFLKINKHAVSNNAMQVEKNPKTE